MPNSRAAAWARAPSRDAMPTISLNSPACMLGITRLTAIFATPNTPHRTFFMTWQLYRGGALHWWGGPPGPGVPSGDDAPVGLCAPCVVPMWLFQQRVQGDPRGPGGPPHQS